jgi:glycosyltransferase involved in cell wall biosynthesis
MSSPAIVSFSKFTTFSQELAALESIRVSRRSQITNYPKVSVLVSTLRSDDLTALLKQIYTQSLPSFELILGLHTIDLVSEHKALIAKLKKRNVTTVVKKFDSSFNLGSILTTLAKNSTGEFIAKMDDDDYYGPEHLRDLVDGAVATDADVVGRAMNYVYLEPLQLTVRRFAPHGTQAVELWSDWVCGGTILARRDKAEAAGWFGAGSTAVDRFLLSGITNNGGKIWRTFGAGYIYRRTFTFHTYVTNYSKYLNGANEQVVGLWDHPIFGEVKTS